jgi:hypothetical protein
LTSIPSGVRQVRLSGDLPRSSFEGFPGGEIGLVGHDGLLETGQALDARRDDAR